ncbi:hypothetical protein QYM46_17215 [Brevibacterium sp. K11IcPPYGO002]|uniref:hypothetical protein n=2 Tax=unclassified Brevibacterium TaxID=2614124 RepID=UPI003D812C05
MSDPTSDQHPTRPLSGMVTIVTFDPGMIERSTMLVTVELHAIRFAEVAGSTRELDRHGRPAGGHRSTI